MSKVGEKFRFIKTLDGRNEDLGVGHRDYKPIYEITDIEVVDGDKRIYFKRVDGGSEQSLTKKKFSLVTQKISNGGGKRKSKRTKRKSKRTKRKSKRTNKTKRRT